MARCECSLANGVLSLSPGRAGSPASAGRRRVFDPLPPKVDVTRAKRTGAAELPEGLHRRREPLTLLSHCIARQDASARRLVRG
jgi:hypothetical protein